MIVVVGSLLRQWRPVRLGTRCNVDVRIRANSLHSLNTQERIQSMTADTATEFGRFWKAYQRSPLTGTLPSLLIVSLPPSLLIFFNLLSFPCFFVHTLPLYTCLYLVPLLICQAVISSYVQYVRNYTVCSTSNCPYY